MVRRQVNSRGSTEEEDEMHSSSLVTCDLALESSSHVTGHSPSILITSPEAWGALIVLPFLIWVLSTACGIMHFRSLPRKKSDVDHFMQWFDAIFRVVGPLLPLIPWTLRCTSCLAVSQPQSLNRKAAISQSSIIDSSPHVNLPKATLLWPCLVAYISISSIRIALYIVHLALQRHGGLSRSEPWVSDHVFLAASVVACLHSEIICSLSDVIKLEINGAAIYREVASVTAFVMAATLHVLVCIDIYFTCRHFHLPSESAAGVLAGLVIFQAPLLSWLVIERSRGKIKPPTSLAGQKVG